MLLVRRRMSRERAGQGRAGVIDFSNVPRDRPDGCVRLAHARTCGVAHKAKKKARIAPGLSPSCDSELEDRLAYAVAGLEPRLRDEAHADRAEPGRDVAADIASAGDC